MNKTIVLALAAALLMTACDDTDPGTHREVTAKYNLPESMRDCKVHYMSGGNSVREITVVRCPNSTTSTSAVVSTGKSSRVDTVVVIDGVEYQLTPKE